jgi:hypothetical protein
MLSVMVSTVDKKNYSLVAINEAMSAQEQVN